MNFGPTTQRFLVALAVVALLLTIWRAAAFPIAEQQKAVERELEKSGQTSPAPIREASGAATEPATLEGSGEQPAPEDD